MNRRSRAVMPGACIARIAVAACLLSAAVSCATAPPYVRPDVTPPPAYRELGDWKAANPSDATLRGPWWHVFSDPVLNDLEDRLTVSNNTLKAAQAQFDQARALVRTAIAGQYPQVGGVASTTRVGQSPNKPNPAKVTDYNDLLVRVDAAYELDVWGRVRQTVLANRAAAQASAADLETVGLSLHAELALDYFQLRALDADRRILDLSVAAFEKALELTTNRNKGGVATEADVALARTQLETTRAQAIDTEIRRSQFEHAIATLMGTPPAAFRLPPAPIDGVVPDIPPGLPADVLERRPDIAAAERRLAAANAQIGVTRAAFFPVVNLTGSVGLESSTLGQWIQAASNLWQAAPTAAMLLFDGGRRKAASDQAVAAYERAESLYRETVLTAFREVEDNLAALRVLALEAKVQDAAVAAAERALLLATNRYKGGVATYLEVITTQNTALNNRRTAQNILSRRQTASILLIKAMGGGWDVSKLPFITNSVPGAPRAPLPPVQK